MKRILLTGNEPDFQKIVLAAIERLKKRGNLVERPDGTLKLTKKGWAATISRPARRTN